ncbi:hypothetical protein BDQ17DRAFT_1328408 [Cyathus striatus]|nr:hypothetical protein BDQ17DRAFT_1328408 [Cyathus striatus]
MIDFNIDFALEKRTNRLVDKLYLLLHTSYDFKLLNVRSPAAHRQRSIRIEATGASTTIKTLFLNLESQDSVHHAAKKIASGELGIPKIDFLLNNAGIMAVPYKKIDGYESQFFCNHLSHFLFMNLILSHIKSPGGRILSITSLGHRRSPVRFDDINFKDGEVYNRWVGYGQAKTAIILFAIGLNKRFSETKGIQSYSVHPGTIDGTGLGEHLDFIAEGFKDENGNWKFPTVTFDQGVATYLYGALSPELDGKGGAYLTESQIKDTEFPMTDEDTERLWELSNSILGTKY